MKSETPASKYEKFVASYLRLNGFFTVPNFIVHAADDKKRISGGSIGNYTETDIIGVRMPHSNEKTGDLHIANDPVLVNGAIGKFDVVIAEVKSGKKNRELNSVWHGEHAITVGRYITRFVGLHREDQIEAVAQNLVTAFRFEDDRTRFRHIVFANKPNKHFQKKGLTYITFQQVIEFIVLVRGQCWINANIGVASAHSQWDDLLVDVFSIANKQESPAECIRQIKSMLDN